MKARNLILALAATGAAAGSFALPTVASASFNVPSTGGTSLKMVEPATLANNGSFEIEIVATHAVNMCDFYLYRETDEYGYQYLGYYGGTSTDDQVSDSWGYTYYDMYPVDCSSNEGTGTDSNGFYPYTWDNPFSGYAGSYATETNSKFYGGTALLLLSKNSAAEWDTDCDYNFSVVIGTGPTGGVGSVSVEGRSMGTINFYSKKAGYKKIEFKDGYSSCEYSYVDIVMTGKGAKGGYEGWLDAGTELYD
jgi:hypothetical protein